MRRHLNWILAAAFSALLSGQGGASVVQNRDSNPPVQSGGNKVKASHGHTVPYSIVGAVAQSRWWVPCVTWPWQWFARPPAGVAVRPPPPPPPLMPPFR